MGIVQNTKIQVYTFKFVQNLPILVFGTKYFSFSKSNAHCGVSWGWACNLGIDIITAMGRRQMHSHDDIGAKP
jgi:hypothetical protein